MEDNHQIINFAPSSSSSVMSLKKYDVFLSFRGEDTRDNFISHLYDALKKEVETYIDYRLEKGDAISHTFIKAIQDSHVFVVIFSENYASSKWCLNELSVILQCKRDHGQIVIPVFYKVDPSHVRKQTGSYQEAFEKHEQDLNNSDDDKLHRWRCALTDAANLAGWDSRNRNEPEFIKDIVKDVLQKLNIRYPVDQLKGVVGIKENCAEIESLLELGSTEVVRVIGIWGMGGIGKTTLARALYAKLSIQFEGHCFLKSVREQSEKNGLDALRNILFSELLREKNLQVESHYVMRRLARKKVLIVLDDVATSEQLDELINDYNCFAPGSRVIVTTRDKNIFSQVNVIYEVKGLNNYDSLLLFYLNAFGGENPKEGYEVLSRSVLAYCKGNPLALRVLGARLRSRSIEACESELRKLQKLPNMTINNVLKWSFDSLDSYERDVILDIACLLKGEKKDYLTSLLDTYGFYGTVGIEYLINKSLITISDSGRIRMCDLIQEMSQNVVRESSEHPGRRSRLWDPEEVCDVLKNNKGTEAVECIVLDVSKIKELHLASNSFTKMTKIRILKFFSSVRGEGCNKIYIPNGLESFSNELRYLEWHGCCLESLPSIFRARYLVKLVMPYSNLKKLSDGVLELWNLEEIDLTYSKNLVELPDLSRAISLEVLRLNECISLREVHPSLFLLPKLKNLDLQGCTKIESLETDVHLKSLRDLNLCNCSALKKFSVFSKKLESLQLNGTSIHELSTSIWHCEKLVNLSLRRCYNLKSLGRKLSHNPANASLLYLDLSGCNLVNESNLRLILDGMRSLIRMNLEDCCNLRALPDSIGSATSLEELDLSGCINVVMLSPSIKNLLNLIVLKLDNCRKLVSLPELPPFVEMLSATNLRELQALPDCIGSSLSLQCLDLSGCINVEMLSPSIKNLLNLRELRLDECRKLVSLPELSPSLQLLSAINCTSLQQKDFTQLLPVVEPNISGDDRYVILPGAQVPDMFRFRAEGDSITFPRLPEFRGFICCLILPHIPPDINNGYVNYCINNCPNGISPDILFRGHSSISDHVLLCSMDKFDILQGSAWVPNRMTFKFSYRNGSSINRIEIKRCGVSPVYVSQDQQQNYSNRAWW